MNRILLSRTTAARVIGGLLLFLALTLGSLLLAGCDLADPVRPRTLAYESTGDLRVLLQSSKTINVPPTLASPATYFFDEDDALIGKVEVTISRVELRGKGGERVTLSNEPETFDLLELQGGESALLALHKNLPGRRYNRIELTISKAVVVLDLEVKPVRLVAEVPKKATIVPLSDFKIEGAHLAKLALNFDLEKSFTIQAEPQLHLTLKPAVEALGVNYEAEDSEPEGDEDLVFSDGRED